MAHPTQVLLRVDNQVAYPVIDDIPVLLTPERLSSDPDRQNVADERWAEAYEEMSFYNDAATHVSAATIETLRRLEHVPFPSVAWLDATYDSASQLDAYRHLGRVEGKRVVQLGGSGSHAVKFLLAGAAESWLVTPMFGEAVHGRMLAERLGVGDRFRSVVAVAEELPFEDGTFDDIYAGGCLHHMSTPHAAPEVRRVLAPGGKFAAIEPWETKLRQVGTSVIGRREDHDHCRPLNDGRMVPMLNAFPDLEVRHHGPLLRYVALAAQKVTHRRLPMHVALTLWRIDDVLPLPGKMGGSVAVLAIR
jgi:SAM-dependent methyltransferase